MEISTEIAIVAMLGGAGTILGPIVGSFVLEFAGEMFKTYFKEANLLIYGVLIVVVVLFPARRNRRDRHPEGARLEESAGGAVCRAPAFSAADEASRLPSETEETEHNIPRERN